MAAKFGKFLLAMLLSVPISACGLIAVLGLPRIQALSAALVEHASGQKEESGSAWEEEILGDPFGHSAPAWEDSRHLSQEAGSAAPTANAANPFAAAAVQAAGSESIPVQGEESRFASNSDPGIAWSAQTPSVPSGGVAGSPSTAGMSPSNMGTGSLETATPPSSVGMPSTQFPAANTDPGSPRQPMLSWREASLKLTEVGIQRYHLEPGATGNSFLFVCLFSPADAPQVTHRFESEADDPLLAVNQTLEQVDRWMRERHAMRTYPASRSLSFQTTTETR